MAAAKDPFRPVLEAVTRYQETLGHLLKKVFRKIASTVAPLRRFVDPLAARAKEIGSTVGKAVVDRVLAAARAVLGAVDAVPEALRVAVRLGKKILALVGSAADPARVAGTVKRLFTRYVRLFRDILAAVGDLLGQLSPLETALGVIASLRHVLGTAFAWIADVTGAASAVKKIKAMVRKAVKAIRRKVKEAVALRRTVQKLQPA